MKSERPIRPYTPDSFARAATAYLERFPCSEAKLERVLTLKFIKRGQPIEKEWISNAVAEARRIGFIDDARYGQAIFDGYVRQGLPSIRIRQKLQLKQLSEAQISELMATLPNDTETKRAAVAVYARRKRLGRFNPRHPEPKDYARLRRAGFAHDVVEWVCNDVAAD